MLTIYSETLLGVLLNRLTEAERRAKLLNLEVKSIRKEISTLQQSLTDIGALNESLSDGDLVLPSTSSTKQKATTRYI